MIMQAVLFYILTLTSWCPAFNQGVLYPYVEYVDLPENWAEYRQLQKPVVVGIRTTATEIIGDTNYLTCELVVEYQPLERGEGIRVLGDFYAEIYFAGAFIDPDFIWSLVASDACRFTDMPDSEE
jgi:hypothetical protein